MKSWIITGGIGCGKSSFVSCLSRLLGGGLTVFSADQEAQRWLDDEAMLVALERDFGMEAVFRDQHPRRANRDWLRKTVFSDPELRRRLEALLHPPVLAGLEMARAQAAQSGQELFLAEVPLHYEIGGTVTADLIIVVAASQTVQVRRLMERRALDQSVIEQMLRSQWPIEAKVERADVVIWNDGDFAALEAQVLTLARQHWHDESNRTPRNR